LLLFNNVYVGRSICERFDVGRATAVRAVRRVTDALFTIAPTFIKWPELERATIISAAIEERSRFPRVIGAVDGTYINIPAPSTDQYT